MNKALNLFVGLPIVLMLAGCGLFEDETGVDYVGMYDSEVHACAAIAMAASLRDDTRTPSSIWARNVEADLTAQADDFKQVVYLISGETHVRTDSLNVYSWICTVTTNYPEKRLEAVLDRFELTSQ